MWIHRGKHRKMATNDRLPPELDCSNLSREWPTWKRTFQMYMLATGKDLDPEPKKIATFLWLIGPRAMEIYNTLFPNDGTTDGIVGNAIVQADNDAANQQQEDGIPPIEAVQQQESRQLNTTVIEVFDGYCIPRKNISMESFKFNNITQKEKQSFTDFETELRKQVQYCEFKCSCNQSYEHRMLIDRIIIGVNDKKLQLKLLDSKGDSLQQIVDKCKTFEAANKNKTLLERNISQHNVYSVDTNEHTSTDEINAISRRCYNCGALFLPGHLSYDYTNC